MDSYKLYLDRDLLLHCVYTQYTGVYTQTGHDNPPLNDIKYVQSSRKYYDHCGLILRWPA